MLICNMLYMLDLTGKNFTGHHRILQYRDASSMLEAETRYLAIKAWWASSNCTSEEGLKHLQLWLAFWHFRYRQWGGFMELVRLYSYCCLFLLLPYFWIFVYFLYCHSILQEKIMTAEEFAQMPNCSLAEFIHNKWLQASGNKGDDLYVATVDPGYATPILYAGGIVLKTA
jgi:hypothetical protein